jgi:hypothetical protein
VSRGGLKNQCTGSMFTRMSIAWPNPAQGSAATTQRAIANLPPPLRPCGGYCGDVGGRDCRAGSYAASPEPESTQQSIWDDVLVTYVSQHEVKHCIPVRYESRDAVFRIIAYVGHNAAS